MSTDFPSDRSVDGAAAELPPAEARQPDRPLQARVLGLPVHLLDDYVAWLAARQRAGRGARVVTLNAEMAIQAERDRRLAEAIRSADLSVPDGSGVALYLRLRGYPVRRIPGIELAEALLRERLGPVWFFGGKPGTAERAAAEWRSRVPGLEFAGIYDGYGSEADEEAMLAELGDRAPGLILVGLGVPRQEFWIVQNRHLAPEAIWIGVGGSFDIWSGDKERAPAFWCDHHLEWLYRLYQEPWRWRRMLALPLFVWRVSLEALGFKPLRAGS